ncbi:MAG: ABC transporter ATP-binding protein [Alphaproteobacteria bacterium]|nr:ABC transporter ATP-binding protein [Alphaproteobacteria bacterium]
MARITLDELAHSYLEEPRAEADYALRTMNHVWEDGGAYALLGPSGCGKTTLLNLISGLLTPTQGRVMFNSEDVTTLEPQARNIAQVFQFPVIYDTMTVADNLAFPLRNRGVDEADVQKRVGEIAELLELVPDLKKRARGLTADAKQKISLGRGLVRSDVAAILFDEPLTVIDPQVKFQLRRKLREIHEEFALTLVYVTHDQNEALTLADKVAVMVDGQVVQLGTPQELFENPAHTFVGYFIGSPGMNLLDCQLHGGVAQIGGMSLPLAYDTVKAARGANGSLKLGIRPEFLELMTEPEDGALPVTINTIEDLGNYKIVRVKLGPEELAIKLPEEQPVPSEQAFVGFPPRWTKIYADDRLVA